MRKQGLNPGQHAILEQERKEATMFSLSFFVFFLIVHQKHLLVSSQTRNSNYHRNVYSTDEHTGTDMAATRSPSPSPSPR